MSLKEGGAHLHTLQTDITAVALHLGYFCLQGLQCKFGDTPAPIRFHSAIHAPAGRWERNAPLAGTGSIDEMHRMRHYYRFLYVNRYLSACAHNSLLGDGRPKKPWIKANIPCHRQIQVTADQLG